MFLHLTVILYTRRGRYDTPLRGQPPTHTPGHPPWTHISWTHDPRDIHHPLDTHPQIRLTGGRYASYWNAFLFYCRVCTNKNEVEAQDDTGRQNQELIRCQDWVNYIGINFGLLIYFAFLVQTYVQENRYVNLE